MRSAPARASAGRDRPGRQKFDPPGRASRRGPDLPPGQLQRRQLVQRCTLRQRIVDPPGQGQRTLDQIVGRRVSRGAVERLCDEQMRLRRQIAVGQRPTPIDQGLHLPGGRLGRHQARATIDPLGVLREITGRTGPITPAQGGLGREQPQPQGLVTEMT